MTWYKDLKMRNKLILAFSLVLALTVFVGGFAIVKLSQLGAITLDIARNKMPVMHSVANLNSIVGSFRRGELLAVLSNDAESINKYLKRNQEAQEKLKAEMVVYEKLIDTEAEKKTYADLNSSLDAYFREYPKIVELVLQNKDEEASTLLRGESSKAFNKSLKILETMEADEFKHAQNAGDQAAKVSNTSRNSIIMCLITCIAIGITLAFLIARIIATPLRTLALEASTIADGDLTVNIQASSKDEIGLLAQTFHRMVENLRLMISQVADNSVQVAAAANQLHSTAESIAAGSEEVASQTGTVATASEEMSATSGDIAQNCQRAADNARKASQSAINGGVVVRETIDGMTTIANQVKQAAKTVEGLGERSDQIGAIIGTIEDIADQTNLLALNAAIEAARAGEQGRGFAVVADEVRALAERTTRATREIGDMIKAIQSETKGVVAAMNLGVVEVEKGTSSSMKSVSALDEILEQINDVAMEVNQIATAIEEQAATTGEITNNINQITQVVHETATGAHHTAKASGELSGLAVALQDIVHKFRLA